MWPALLQTHGPAPSAEAAKGVAVVVPPVPIGPAAKGGITNGRLPGSSRKSSKVHTRLCGARNLARQSSSRSCLRALKITRTRRATREAAGRAWDKSLTLNLQEWVEFYSYAYLG